MYGVTDVRAGISRGARVGDGLMYGHLNRKLTAGRGYKGVIKGFKPPKLPKLDVTTDAEYVANLVCQYVAVNVQ